MKKGKKVITLFLLIGIIMTMFLSGCGNQGESADVQDQNNSDGVEEKKAALEELTITVDGNVIPFPEGIDENNNFIIEYWEEKSGIDITYNILPLEEAIQKLNVMMSSGTAGDIISMRDSSLIGKYAAENLIVPVDDYLKNTVHLNNLPEAIKTLTTVDGKQYALGLVNPLPGTVATVVRKDWMKNVGIDKQPETVEEFIDMLRAFTTGDPDKNGKDDTVGMIVLGSPDNSQTFYMLRGLFNIPNNYQVKDGKIVFTLIEPEAKEYLKFVTQLYNEGLIPKDFAGLEAQAAVDLLVGNTAGVFTDWPWGNRTNIETIKEKYNGELVYLDPPKSFTGDKTYTPTQTPISMSVMITKECKDPQAAVNFLDMLLEEDVQLVSNYGLENEHYTMQDGKSVPTEKVANGEIEIGWNVYFANHLLQSPEVWHYKDAVLQGWGEYYYPTELTAGGLCPADVFMPPQPELKSIEAELATMVSQFYTDVVTGVKSIDEFDTFKKDWLNNGGQEILDGYNALYEELGRPEFVHPEAGKERESFQGKFLFNGSK